VILPLLVLLPGHGWFGSIKGQGLFTSDEYLENERSSSLADLAESAGANRRVPDSSRVTSPLMAVQVHGSYVGMIWDPTPELSALFDSPDRALCREAHVLGLLAPGANGANRENGALLPLQPLTLNGSRPLLARARVIGGKGARVVPDVQQYVALKGLPQTP
jgi:hypothetical protein